MNNQNDLFKNMMKAAKHASENKRLLDVLETIEIMTKDARNRREDYRRVVREALEVSE